MAAPVYIIDGSQMGDPLFTAVISEQMRVPDRLRVAQSAVEDLKSRHDDLLPVYSMHVPDRLALIDAPDLSPRPSFSHHRAFGHASSMWDLHRRPWNKDPNRELVQSPLRRSYSDQTFCATPKSTPTHIYHPLHSPLVSQDAEAISTRSTEQTHPTGLGAIAPNLLSPQNLLQAARKLGQQASHRILRTVTERYPHRFGFQKNPRSQPDKDQTDEIRRSSGAQELWMNSEEESGSNVECMVLRRQMMKMNRRLAALEKQNADRRQNELLLFSLVISAFMINSWLWMRR